MTTTVANNNNNNDTNSAFLLRSSSYGGSRSKKAPNPMNFFKVAQEEENNNTPRFFSAGEYALEVHAAESFDNDDQENNSQLCNTSTSNNTNNKSSTTTMSIIRVSPVPIPAPSVRKTVYLIRHAESDENRRQQSLRRSVRVMRSLSLPQIHDVQASLELVDMPAQIDSNVSPVGKRQIEQVGSKLRKDSFLEEAGVELVVHSPLRRAEQTCLGMLGCAAPECYNRREEGDQVISTSNSNDNDDNENDNTNNADSSSAIDQLPGHVRRVVSLPCLTERTPLEALPGPHDKFTSRIAEFEQWLSCQSESVVAVVGHSHYFCCMLGLPEKFGNCDVWKVEFDASVAKVDAVNNKKVAKSVRKKAKEKFVKEIDRRTEKVVQATSQAKEKFVKEIDRRTEKVVQEINIKTENVKNEWKKFVSESQRLIGTPTTNNNKKIEGDDDETNSCTDNGNNSDNDEETTSITSNNDDDNNKNNNQQQLQSEETRSTSPSILHTRADLEDKRDDEQEQQQEGDDNTDDIIKNEGGNDDDDGSSSDDSDSSNLVTVEVKVEDDLPRGWSNLVNLYKYEPPEQQIETEEEEEEVKDEQEAEEEELKSSIN